MNKKILIVAIVAALIGGFFGSLTFSYLARAVEQTNVAQAQGNVWDSFYNNFLKPLIPDFKNSSVPNLFGQSASTSISVAPYAPTVDYEQQVVNAVDQASQAVVSVIISKNVPIVTQCPYDPFADLPPEFQQYFGQDFQMTQPCQKSNQTQLQEIGGGSGFIITSDGLIVTNKHVVNDTQAQYTVFTNDGKKYDAQVVARDPSNDIAIIKITANNLPVLTLGDSDSIRLGQTAIAIGNALAEFRNTVSVGVISGLSRNISAEGAGITENIGGLIQTDAAINPGNSGGPLLNLKGEVIGINTAVVSGAQNIGFAIPINQVKKAIQSVKATGAINYPFLGVRYVNIDSDIASQNNLPVSEGAWIQKGTNGPAIISGSPADKAGLKNRDIIEEVNNEKITASNSLALLIQKYNIGDKIALKILRDKKEMTLNVTLEQRPKSL